MYALASEILNHEKYHKFNKKKVKQKNCIEIDLLSRSWITETKKNTYCQKTKTFLV